MTELEKSVPNPELCQRMKDAGLVQTGWALYWVRRTFELSWMLIRRDLVLDYSGILLAAPTSAILGEWIGKIGCGHPQTSSANKWICFVDGEYREFLTEADARAELVLELDKRKILSLKECKP